MTIRVVVADDHAVVRSGLEQLLSTAADIELVGTAGNGGEAVEVVGRERPDVVLMDLSMPEVDGVEATRRIIAADPDARVVVLTSFADDRHISEALQAGAIGYVLKHAEPDELLGAIRAAAAGDAPLDPKAARVLLDSQQGAIGPTTERTRGRGAASGRGGSRQQADRPAPRHRRAHGEGAPHEHLRPHRSDRPDAGRALGRAQPAAGRRSVGTVLTTQPWPDPPDPLDPPPSTS